MTEGPVVLTRNEAEQTIAITLPEGSSVILVAFLPGHAGQPSVHMAGELSALQLLGAGALLNEHGRGIVQDGREAMRREELVRAQRAMASDPAARLVVPTR